MGELQLSLVVPAYNEGRRLRRSLPEMRAFLEDLLPGAAEIVVVDDGSGDDTARVAREGLRGFESRVLSLPENRGKGYAVKSGLLAARGDLRLFTDADLSTPLSEIPRFLAAHRSGADVVIGTRNHPQARVDVHQPFLRESMGKAFTFLANLLVVSGISDFTCGFKSLTAEAAESIFPVLRIEGWAFDVELLWQARRQGLSIRPLPVRWRNDPDTRVNGLTDAAHSFLALLTLLHRRLN